MVALGLQRSQEAGPLLVLWEQPGQPWVREAQGHHPSGAGRAAIRHAEEYRVQGRKNMRWSRGRILCACVCVCVYVGGGPNFECRFFFHLFIRLLLNKYLPFSRHCVKKQSVTAATHKLRTQASEQGMMVVESWLFPERITGKN